MINMSLLLSIVKMSPLDFLVYMPLQITYKENFCEKLIQSNPNTPWCFIQWEERKVQADFNSTLLEG